VIVESEMRAGSPIRLLLYGRKHIYVMNGIKTLMPLGFTEF
jgi:cytidine deaminase